MTSAQAAATDRAADHQLVIDSHVTRPIHPLQAWRKRQLIYDKASKCRRSMRLLDVTVAYGIAHTTWNGWEKWPDEPAWRRPDDDNMRRLFEITKGEITPNDFYPIEEWKAALEG